MNNNTKLKLLIITNRLVIGGPTKDILSTCAVLKNSFDITILCGLPKATDKLYPIPAEITDNINIQYIPNLNSSFNLFETIKAYYQIKKVIKAIKPNIVHTHCAKPGLLGRIAAYNLKVEKLFHTFHGHFFHSYFNKIVSYGIVVIERWLAKKCTYIISLSKQQAFDLINTYKIAPKQKVKIIHLGISNQENASEKEAKRSSFRNKFQLDNKHIAVGIVGRTSPVKNHKLFLDIAIKMKENANLKFFVIGDGDGTYALKQYLIKKEIAYADEGKTNPNASIIFTSWYLNIDEVHYGLDLELLTSLNEGTPLSVIEAMACGTPVIAANVGGVADLIKHNETGVLINEASINNFVISLTELINNANLYNQIAYNAKEFINKNFSVTAETNNLQNLYLA